MAYIYEIINDVNDKRYIGKTEFDIYKRFAEHCRDAFRDRNENRPLYRAMRKYGIEHFHVQLIEETDSPEEREVFWINQRNSFHYGYNATLGGDGKKFIDYDFIIKTYEEVQNISKTARICNVSVDSVRKILILNNIERKSIIDILKERPIKQVKMYDMTDHSKLINTFESAKCAAKYLIENRMVSSCNDDGISGHIRDVCNDKRSSAYGYFWRYAN